MGLFGGITKAFKSIGSGLFGGIAGILTGAISGFFGGQQKMLMEQPPQSASINDPDGAAASARQRKRTLGLSGRSDTIKTSPSGDLGEIGEGGSEKKTLLGY